MKAPKSARIALLTAASLIVGATTAYAATATVTSSIRFLTHITITQVTAPNFGNVSTGVVDDYTLSTAGVVTAAGGAAHLEGGTTAAGDYTVVASTAQGINIYASGYTASGGTTPSAATCKYDAGVETSCAAVGTPLAIGSPLASASLKVGLTVHADGTDADGSTKTPSFTLNVVYQ